MRGEDNKQEAMFSYVSPEKRVPTDHPLRPIRAMVDGNVRVVIVTGGAPGYFNRHFNIPALIQIAESLCASGRDRKSTRLNSSHANTSYAVFRLKRKREKPSRPEA